MFEASLEKVVQRYEELSSLLSDSTILGTKTFVQYSKEYSELQPIVDAARGFHAKIEEMQNLAILMVDGSEESDIRELAELEYYKLKEQIPSLERQVQLMLLPKDVADAKNAILEIRAGTGGDEAALFCADLCRMYQRYAETHKWTFKVIHLSTIGIGGFKEVIISISGSDVFSRLKFESGVHRVQRVPVTESGGRIHTSAATVAVLPEAAEVDLEIHEKDLRVDTYRSQGAGGQHVNTTDSAIRITHIPSGLVVTCQDEKSQHKNRAKAMLILRARLYELERQKQNNLRAADRKSQVGTGDRSERIRTYNFPQGRVTDHRINLTKHNLDKFIEGEMDGIIDALIATDQMEKLAAIS